VKNLYVLILDDGRDCFGNFLDKKGHVIAICVSEEKVQEQIRRINKNPYFTGNLTIVVYELNKDVSGYSLYPPEKETMLLNE
jgi:hypothetical protein